MDSLPQQPPWVHSTGRAGGSAPAGNLPGGATTASHPRRPQKTTSIRRQLGHVAPARNGLAGHNGEGWTAVKSPMTL